MKRKGSYSMMAVLLLSFGLLGGCGQSHTSNTTEGGGSQNGGSGGIAAGSIQTWVEVAQDGGKVRFTFHLKNQTERVKTFHFNTGQRYDFIVKNDQGKKVYQYSEGKMFNQMVGKETLKQGEEMSFQGEVSSLAKGKYTVTFWLTAKNEQPKASIGFEVQ